MSITQLSPSPSRKRPATFADETDAFLGDLPRFVDEVNSLTVQYENDAATLAANTPVVVGIANFKGLWSNLSGALSVPATVSHLGAYWVLATNLADVTAKIPGTDPEWLAAQTGNHQFNLHNGVI